MDKKILATKLGLNENADDNTITEKLASVINSASQLTALQQEALKLKGDVAAKDTEISNLKTAAENEKIENLVQGAIDAKKIVAGDKDKYKKLAAADYATVKELFEAMRPYESLESKLSIGGSGITPGADAEVAELMKLSGSELYMQDKFPRLQELSQEHFKLKYKEYYGHDYTS